jgi:hypothetical protein
MRRLVLVAGLAAVTLSACGGPGEVATDPGAQPAAMPTAIPAAPGPVYTGLVTVLDKGDGAPEACLGVVEDSYPPQCDGPPIIGWSWKDNPIHEHPSDVTFGQFALTGTWDGTSLTVDGAIPGALYDPMKPGASPTLPVPETSYDAEGLQSIQADLQQLPGYLSGDDDEAHGLVHAQVVYDDGTLQQWCDDTYGANVVVVTSALTDETP